MSADSTSVPEAITARKDDGVLELRWAGDTVVRLPFRPLRLNCPCAACVDELSGRRIIQPADVAADVQPTSMNHVGNYAIKIVWSDGHDTGLFTWRLLRDLSNLDEGV